MVNRSLPWLKLRGRIETMAGLMPGIATLKIVADDETGELESATILGKFGEVPEDFAESLQGG